MAFGVMEIVDFNAYDLKFLAKNDINYNPALGSGQLQINNMRGANSEMFGPFLVFVIVTAIDKHTLPRNLKHLLNE
ncbi:MAG: hypothetical protein LBB61_09085 [Treponema sp.]|jgi:hypothetical protein|nr:hypothetical protein [Treponema sp.]